MKKDITTKYELIKDIENIKNDIEWAKENNKELLEWLNASLKYKQRKLSQL